MSLFLHSDVHNMNRKTVENIILGITNDLLGEWKDKFKTISVYADNPILRDNGMTSDYFSEIEVNFLYEDHSFADVFSIIVLIILLASLLLASFLSTTTLIVLFSTSTKALLKPASLIILVISFSKAAVSLASLIDARALAISSLLLSLEAMIALFSLIKSARF